MIRRALAALLVAIAAIAWSGAARAVVDPARAQDDVDAAMHDGDYAFCRKPREPLSHRALALCPHARAIAGCEGFAAACDRAEKKAPARASGKPPGAPSHFALPAFLGTLAQAMVWLLVAALVLAVLVPVVRALVRMRRDRQLAEPAPAPSAAPEAAPAVDIPATTDEELLLRRADELSHRGDYAAALQTYLAASLRALDKRGAVRIARDRTNGEYVRACADAAARPALRGIVREVDRVQFGGEPATADSASRAGRHAAAIVRALPVTLLAMAVVLLLGCGGGGGAHTRPAHDGDDPAGDALFYDVLQREGLHVQPLSTSLASLRPPAVGERAPAVVVDVERTELDDDTRDHLVDWVAAGGVLVLAGDPARWPDAFGASPALTTGARSLTARRLLAGEVGGEPVFSEPTEQGELASGDAVAFHGAENVAWFGDTTTYAALVGRGRGVVLGIATDELLTNVGLARPGNAGAMLAIVSSTGRDELRVAQPDDGVSPPSTPIAALTRAGLGLGLAHALVAVIVLFLAVGTRLTRPRPAPPPVRRAFTEHVEAVGALYARTGSAPHALAAYARFADERLRARMPRGTSDVAAFLATRAGAPLESCQRIWTRAMASKAGAPPLGDELTVLKELSAVVSAAMGRDR